MNKCKGCEWYGKPYWSIINPCENCPREETNVVIITRWTDTTIEEKDKEIKRLKKQSNNYAKRIIKTIDLLEEARENIDLPWYDRQHLIEKTINELKGEDNE